MQKIGWLASLVATLAGSSGSAGGTAETPGHEALLIDDARQLIFAGRRSGEGYFGADGRRMIFQSEREPGSPFFQMYVMDLETGDTVRLSPGVGKTTCGWLHPDGKRALFASTHHDPEAVAKQAAEMEARAAGRGRRYAWSFDEQFELYVADLDDGSLRRLTDALGYDAEGSYSPDGRHVVFASNRHAYAGTLEGAEAELLGTDPSYFLELYRMRADGTELRRLTDVPGYDGGPFFSPDGRRIVWRRFSPDGARAEIWTMAFDGSDARPVTALGAMSWAPFYHPSGDYLIFATNLHGFDDFELYLVDAAGERDPVRVTETPGFDGLPVFSPDGERLAWTTNRTADGRAQIFIGDWNDTAARALLGIDQDAAARGGSGTAHGGLAPTDTEIRAADLRVHAAALAAPTPGGTVAAAAERLAALGLEPAGDEGFFASVTYDTGAELETGNRLAVVGPTTSRDLLLHEQWRPLAVSATGEFPPAGVVFVGHGLAAASAGDAAGNEPAASADVAGRWVLALAAAPAAEHGSGDALHAQLAAAAARGARGLVHVPAAASTGPAPFTPGPAASTAGLVVVSVSREVAAYWLLASGRTLDELEASLATGTDVPPFAIPGLELAAAVRLRQERAVRRSVVGRLPASGSAAAAPVVVGAVAGTGPEELAAAAALLEVAEQLGGQVAAGSLELRRDLVVALWAAELGEAAAAAWLAQAGTGFHDARRAAAYVELGSLGDGEPVTVEGSGTSPIWPLELERRNAPIGLALTARDAAPTSGAASAFVAAGVPALRLVSSPAARSASGEGTARAVRLAGLLLRARLADEATPPLRSSAAPAPPRARRPYLGTVPDYRPADEPGVRLSGVTEGSPADLAGLREGDRVVELGGQAVDDIRAYASAVDALVIGAEASVVVVRDGERRTFAVVPGARD